MTASADASSESGSGESFFGLARLLHRGGWRRHDEPEPTPDDGPLNALTAPPLEALEVKKLGSHLTQGNGIQAPIAKAPDINLSVTSETFEILERLHKAGIIDLGQTLIQTDEKLTTWEYPDFLKHMVAVQKLRPTKLNGRDSTALCRQRYIRFMEEHPVVPVQLRPPSEESWLEHVAYRIQEEEKAGSALNQQRKALKSLLRFLGQSWPSLDKGFDEVRPHWTLPPDDLVPRFWEDTHYAGEPYLNATIQHVFHFGFWAGVRPPSELCALNLGDVDFDARSVIVTEIKKGGRRRDLSDIEPFVVSAMNGKTLKHYVDHVRPQVATRKSEALFLNEKGERFHPNDLGVRLSECGKRIWPPFTPYTMRRWCATTRLIDTKFNVYFVAEWLGDTVATVEKHYIEKARARGAMHGQYHARRRRLTHAP